MKYFGITEKDIARIDEWLTTIVYPAIIEDQRNSELVDNPIAVESWEMGYPYEGAIGGGLTYTFSPTSLGVVSKVIYGDPDAGDYVLDLTDYDSW